MKPVHHRACGAKPMISCGIVVELYRKEAVKYMVDLWSIERHRKTSLDMEVSQLPR